MTMASRRLFSRCRWRARVAWAACASATSLCPAPVAWAQSAGGFDADALPAPIAPSAFSALESASPLEARALNGGLRASLFTRPVALILPTPSDRGARANAVDAVVLAELTFAAGLGRGFDLGVGLGLHAYQAGTGLSPVTGGERLAPIALADPRITLGWSKKFDEFALRPYATVFVPLGDSSAFASDGFIRSDVGLAASYVFEGVLVEFDIAARLRREVDFGYARLGSGLRVGAGALFSVLPELQVGPEVIVLPQFSAQPEPLTGDAGFLLPAEARLTARVVVDRWTFLASGGTGLPFSRPSGLDPNAGLVRGLTSPTFRGLLELRTTF